MQITALAIGLIAAVLALVAALYHNYKMGRQLMDGINDHLKNLNEQLKKAQERTKNAKKEYDSTCGKSGSSGSDNPNNYSK